MGTLPPGPQDPPPWEGVAEEPYIPRLRALFAHHLVEHGRTVDRVTDRLVRLIEEGEADETVTRVAVARDAEGVAHTVLGTAATFLAHDLSDAAGAISEAVLGGEPERWGAGDLTELHRRLERFRAEIDRFLTWTKEGRPD